MKVKKSFLIAIFIFLICGSFATSLNFGLNSSLFAKENFVTENASSYQIEDNDEKLSNDYLDFYSIPSSYFTYSNNGGAEGNSVLKNAFDRNFQTTFVSNSVQNSGASNPTPEQVFLNTIDVNFNGEVKINRILYACGQRSSTPWGYPVTLSVYYDNNDGNGLRLFKAFESSATTKFVVFNFGEELTVSAIRLEYTSLLKQHSWKATAREIIFLQQESNEYEIYKNLFTDYAQTKLNTNVNSYEKICEFENNLKNNVNFLGTNNKIERAKKVAKGEIQFNPELEFSTNLKAKKVINRHGNLESYCRNTLLLSSFGTNRQVLGISANALDEITIFVDANDNDPLPKIRFSQHVGHWRSWLGGEVQLKKGKNTFTVPSFYHSDYTVDVKLGGPIYLCNPFTKAEQSENVKVYVEGGTLYPVLNDKISESEFLAQLNSYYEYYSSAPENVVNVTEIVTQHAIITVDCSKAKEIYSNFSPKKAIKNWNDYMDKLLEFGGISQNSKSETFDERNLNIKFNIRVTQPWPGGWMFAAGEHVGVTQGSQTSLIYGSGFGWGVSHEIGHTLDNRLRVISETTNNMWAKFNETVIEKACTRGNFDETLETLSNDLTYDETNFFVDKPYNYLIWWYIETWQKGYWGNLENCYRGIYPKLKEFLNRNENLKEKINSLSPTELQVFYSSLVTKTDLSYYFDRWGYSIRNNETDKVFKIISASDSFKEIMNKAIEQKYIDNSKQYKLWYQDCYYYHNESRKNIYSNKNQPTISVVAEASEGYALIINHTEKTNHLGYEILEGNEITGYKVIGFTKTNAFVDETDYDYGYEPSYKVRAIDSTFRTSNLSKAKTPEKFTKNVCRVGTRLYTTLIEAVNNASSGDVIELLDSFLSANVEIEKNLTIKIADEIEKEIIITKFEDGDFFEISSGATLTLSGKENHYLVLNGNNFTQSGSLIKIAGVINAQFVKMINNNSSNGGAIVLQNNSKGSKITNCIISNNKAKNGAGLLCGYAAVSLTLENCLIENNVAENDAIIKSKGTLIIDNCEIKNNSSKLSTINNYEGGVLTIKNSLISNNKAKIGAGLYIDGKTDIINCKISKNVATEKAGGLFFSTTVNARQVKLDNVEFLKNVAPKGNDIVIENGKITLLNIKTNKGSQILLSGGEIRIKNNCKLQSKITISAQANLILQDGIFEGIEKSNFYLQDFEEDMKILSVENFELLEEDEKKIKVSNKNFGAVLKENAIYSIKVSKSFNVVLTVIISASALFLIALIIVIKKHKNRKKRKLYFSNIQTKN